MIWNSILEIRVKNKFFYKVFWLINLPKYIENEKHFKIKLKLSLLGFEPGTCGLPKSLKKQDLNLGPQDLAA